MALEFNQQADTTIPIETPGITPDRLAGKSLDAIKKMRVWHGRKSLELAQLFQVSGSLDESGTLVFRGNLQAVQGIGSGMKSGTIRIESDAGCRIGCQMSGGTIQVLGSVSDYLGAEMAGGEIEVSGNAGDFTGGHLPGSKLGMNRGAILVQGNVGSGMGRRMRRGTIVAGGGAGQLAGWEMLAGTLVVLGRCGAQVGAEMKRGTIVMAGGYDHDLLPTFQRGGQFPVPVLSMLSKWLTNRANSEYSFPGDALNKPFQMFHGDGLQGSRGELFVAEDTSGMVAR